MDKYVKLQNVLETLKKANIGGYITDRLLEIPAAEISISDDEKDEITIEKWNKRADVKHGNWDYSEKEDGECPWYFCSVCDSPAEQLYTDEPLLSEFCPHCGADMRGCSGCKYIDKDKTLLTCTKHNIICKRYTQPCTEYERRQK